MCRSMTSNVSIISDFVAKGHQTMHYVSSSPSKIPYGGFSPVRLQTGIQPQPSLTSMRLKCKAHIHSQLTNLYAAKVLDSEQST